MKDKILIAIDLWMRNGTCIHITTPEKDTILEYARKIYDSFPEEVWQCRRP